MRQTIVKILVLVFCMTMVSVVDAADEFKGAVDTAVADFVAAIKAKDAPKLGSLYANDAIAFPPNAEMVKGREAIQAFWKGFMDDGMTANVETIETESQGNLGSEVGKYTIFDPSGKTVDQGKYVVVWKKGKEGWKLYRDIWNSNMPAEPATK